MFLFILRRLILVVPILIGLTLLALAYIAYAQFKGRRIHFEDD